MGDKIYSHSTFMRMSWLCSHKEFTRHQYEKMFEISKSTFCRDIDFAKNFLNYDIFYDAEKKCHINNGILKGYDGFKIELVRG